jgi:hypothetical protein
LEKVIDEQLELFASDLKILISHNTYKKAVKIGKNFKWKLHKVYLWMYSEAIFIKTSNWEKY